MKNPEYDTPTNKFYYWANYYGNKATEDEKIQNINFTSEFYQELENHIKLGEIIIININGKPAQGKSTVAMAIAQQIIDIMRQHKKTDETFGIKHIVRDQQEYSRIMRNPHLKNTVRVIDEWNSMEETGQNATVEQTLLDYFSDVQAQRFIHRVSCSPTKMSDTNADLLINVIQPDKQRKTTLCHLFYRVNKGELRYPQLLGFLEIDVKDTLEAPWYQEYRKDKKQKWDLILKEGIFRPRELEYAAITKAVVNKIKNLIKIGAANKDVIESYVRREYKIRKIPLTLIGITEATNEVNGHITSWRSLYKIKKMQKTLNMETPIDPEEHKRKLDELRETEKDLLEAIHIQEEDLDRMIEINEEYHKNTTEK